MLKEANGQPGEAGEEYDGRRTTQVVICMSLAVTIYFIEYIKKNSKRVSRTDDDGLSFPFIFSALLLRELLVRLCLEFQELKPPNDIIQTRKQEHFVGYSNLSPSCRGRLQGAESVTEGLEI